MDDKQLAAKIRNLGIDHEKAMLVVGIIAEEKQLAYMDGYNNGYEARSKVDKVPDEKKAIWDQETRCWR